MKFNEFFAGQVITTQDYQVSESEIIDFANRYDPQWFHCDKEAADQGPFQGLIASGWHTCGIAMKLMVEAALKGSESFASPGLDYVKWFHPVRAGDVLSVVAEVIETRRSQSKPDLGILLWKWTLKNQADDAVMELQVTSMFDLSQAAP